MSPETPAWLLRRFVVELHAAQLTEHGGPSGIRDPGGLDSALARPENLQAYGSPDLAALAASYAFGLARNHAFVDGNKRTSFAACVAFLRLNSAELSAPQENCIDTWLALASGTLGEDDLAARSAPASTRPADPEERPDLAFRPAAA